MAYVSIPAGGPLRVVTSDELDFATTGDKTWGTDWLPAMPGFAFQPSTARLITTAQAGAHAANPEWRAGREVNRNDFINASTIVAATLNVSIGLTDKNAPINAGTLNATFPTYLLDGVAPVPFVNVACTAGCTLRGRIWVVGFIVPRY